MHSGEVSFDRAMTIAARWRTMGGRITRISESPAESSRHPEPPVGMERRGVFEMSLLTPTSYRCYSFTGGGWLLTSIWNASMLGDCKRLPSMCYVDAITWAALFLQVSDGPRKARRAPPAHVRMTALALLSSTVPSTTSLHCEAGSPAAQTLLSAIDRLRAAYPLLLWSYFRHGFTVSAASQAGDSISNHASRRRC